MIRAPLAAACSMACAASVIDSSGLAGNRMLASAIRNRFTDIHCIVAGRAATVRERFSPGCNHRWYHTHDRTSVFGSRMKIDKNQINSYPFTILPLTEDEGGGFMIE